MVTKNPWKETDEEEEKWRLTGGREQESQVFLLPTFPILSS